VKAYWFAVIFLLACANTLGQQFSGDVLGNHNLSPGGPSRVQGGLSAPCLYCHAPHSALGAVAPLWNQKLTTETYTTYQSTTLHETGSPMPLLGSDSNLCLSCHDGSVAPGQTVVYGKLAMTGSMAPPDTFGTNLSNSHPFSLVLPLKDSPDLVPSLYNSGKTTDPAGMVRLINGNIECTTCNNAHVEATDLVALNFLVRDGSSGQLCLACHTSASRTVNNQSNYLAGWANNIHATDSNKISTQSAASLGAYPTVALNACTSCHMEHNAPGAARLLRGKNENDCSACHGAAANISPSPMNVCAEFAKQTGHTFSSAAGTHDEAESVLLNQNRHATCVDCHNAHASLQVTSFLPPPALRLSQNAVAGVSATDGITVLNPSVNQYENCLRCHGNSTGKNVNTAYGYTPVRVASSGDPLNVIPQFSLTASSSHPVTHPSSSPLPQPSLLPSMLNLDGITPGRIMGTQIFCTDCHNSDDNREFGGTGPNGPHGSKWSHILERRYEISQAVAPGQLINNLFPNPDVGTVNGPYAMCGKCHDLSNNVVKNTSWNQHSTHINAGFSCATCHTAHGMGGTSPNVSGQRLVNFDANVVAPNGALPISYNRAANSCILVCHQTAHNPNGTVSVAGVRTSPGLKN